jgi:hypothetical protein
VSGDGGVPLRIGRREGHPSARVDTPLALEECLALGLEGVRGIVAASKAYSRRTLGWCLEPGMGFVTFVPRPWAVRQDLDAWGQPPPALPLVLENPGRTKAEAPRRWHGQRVIRQVEVEDRDARVRPAALRFGGVRASHLAQPQAQASAAAQAKEAEAVADHRRQVHARWCACRLDAEAALVESEGRGQGRRGRRPHRWR